MWSGSPVQAPGDTRGAGSGVLCWHMGIWRVEAGVLCWLLEVLRGVLGSVELAPGDMGGQEQGSCLVPGDVEGVGLAGSGGSVLAHGDMGGKSSGLVLMPGGVGGAGAGCWEQ